MKITNEQLDQYMLDVSKLDDQIVIQIELERKIFGSPVAKWFVELGRRLNAGGSDVNWLEMMADASNDPDTVPDETEDDRGIMEQQEILDNIRRYSAMDQNQLNQAMRESVVGTETELVLRSTSGNPLQSYLDQVREIVCKKWDWNTKRNDPHFEEPTNLMISLFDVFSVTSTGIPFPPAMIVAQVLKVTLDKICNEKAGE